MRIFAGPNGSGKTSIINRLKEKISFGNYINADDIEFDLNNSGYQLPLGLGSILDSELNCFIKGTSIIKNKFSDDSEIGELKIIDNKIYCQSKFTNSYLASAIAEFIRLKHIELRISFTFETVFSHPSKLELISLAKKQSFRVYLYYISTESPDINVRRVQIRIAQHGHQVPEKAIRKRYERTMTILPDIIKSCNRAFLFDNSGSQSIYFAEIKEGEEGEEIEIRSNEEDIPDWFFKYVLVE